MSDDVMITDKQRALLAAQDPEDLYGQLAAVGRAPPIGRPRVEEESEMGSKEKIERLIAQYRKATALFGLCEPGERLHQVALDAVNESQTEIENAIRDLRETSPVGSNWRSGYIPVTPGLFPQDQTAIVEKQREDDDEEWFDRCRNFIFSFVGDDFHRLTSWGIELDPERRLAVFKVGFDQHEARHWLDIGPGLPLERVEAWAVKQFGPPTPTSAPSGGDDDETEKVESPAQS